LSSRRVLHVLSQRPSQTGSGITLESMVTQARAAGWDQAAVVGIPAGLDPVQVGNLPRSRIHPLTFAPSDPMATSGALDFPLPGMSDVMPYPSSVWSQLDSGQLDRYRAAWRTHLTAVIADFRPNLIHTHHIWLVSSLLRSLAPDTPLVAHCHATGLRQLSLCPALAREVVDGCRAIDHFCVLRRDHRDQLADTLGVPLTRITVSGAGYREDVFHPTDGGPPPERHLLYVGKFAQAKGLPWLLDAVDRLTVDHPEVRLHVAGGGAGAEAENLRSRMAAMAPRVVMHGQVDQARLGDLMRTCRVMVLPSFYEGVPLVLVEAAACGCRLVATDLPGVREQIAPALGDRLIPVALPRLQGMDTPDPADLPRFTDDLTAALAAALSTPLPAGGCDLSGFTWQAVWGRVERVWEGLLAP